MASVYEIIDSFNRAYDEIAHGKMTLQNISRSGLLKRSYWVVLAGAKYPEGTYEQRVDRAVRKLEFHDKVVLTKLQS